MTTMDTTLLARPLDGLAVASAHPAGAGMTESPAGVDRTDHLADAMTLGATMYVPAVHPDIEDIVAGRRYPSLKSVVLCLEDALHISDVERGLYLLAALLRDCTAHRRTGMRRPRLFLRPRGYEMAQSIVQFAGIEDVDGLVVPKVDIEALSRWWQLAADADLQLMPTLEEPWVFDPMALQEFAAALAEQDQSRLIAVRVGGNDLMASMRLRRLRGRTVYDSPLAWGLSQLMCQLGSRGFALTAPVFDVLDDSTTLARECRLDAEFGFIGKTAIHPSQISVIEREFAVRQEDLDLAKQTLAQDAGAVFRSGGMMLEPATHRAWARRIVALAGTYGVLPGDSAAEPLAL